MLVRHRTIVLFDLYHLATRKLSSMERNMHLLFALFRFGQLKYLLSEQVARSLKHTCQEVSVDDHRVWLAPVPALKGKFMLCVNRGIVKLLLPCGRWWGRIGAWKWSSVVPRHRTIDWGDYRISLNPRG